LESIIPMAAEQGTEVTTREFARTRGFASLALPAFASNGQAVVYANYNCGAGWCGTSWYFLLEKSSNGWRVIDERVVSQGWPAQDVRLTAEDAAIIGAAVDGVVRPQMAQAGQRETPLLIFDRTIAVCPTDKSHPREMGCLSRDQEGLTELSRLSTAFKDDLQEPARTEIRASFLERNKSNVMIPREAVVGVVIATPAEIASKFDPSTGRGALHATFSMPGKSSDGRAVVYVSYWCGNLCAYGWLVLLTKTADRWRIVASELLWVS
jgi:hypothetical protein